MEIKNDKNEEQLDKNQSTEPERINDNNLEALSGGAFFDDVGKALNEAKDLTINAIKLPAEHLIKEGKKIYDDFWKPFNKR